MSIVYSRLKFYYKGTTVKKNLPYSHKKRLKSNNPRRERPDIPVLKRLIRRKKKQ
jgi:hypothetical protein